MKQLQLMLFFVFIFSSNSHASNKGAKHGQGCSTSTKCQKGFKCRKYMNEANVCHYPKYSRSINSSCLGWNSKECKKHLACHKKKCVVPKSRGQQCRNYFPCKKGLTCTQVDDVAGYICAFGRYTRNPGQTCTHRYLQECKSSSCSKGVCGGLTRCQRLQKKLINAQKKFQYARKKAQNRKLKKVRKKRYQDAAKAFQGVIQSYRKLMRSAGCKKKSPASQRLKKVKRKKFKIVVIPPVNQKKKIKWEGVWPRKPIKESKVCKTLRASLYLHKKAVARAIQKIFYGKVDKRYVWRKKGRQALNAALGMIRIMKSSRCPQIPSKKILKGMLFGK